MTPIRVALARKANLICMLVDVSLRIKGRTIAQSFIGIDPRVGMLDGAVCAPRSINESSVIEHEQRIGEGIDVPA